MVIGRSKRQVFNYIKEIVAKKVKNWKTKFLSPGEKEMLKSVVQAMPVYSMSCFKLSKSMCNDTRMATKFWWSKGQQDNSLHWIAWEKLTEP